MLILSVLGLILIVATVLEFIPTDLWWIRVFDFPHFQIWWLSVFTLIGFAFFSHYLSKFNAVIIILLTGAVLYKSYKIFPYTIFAPKRAAQAERVTKVNTISLLIANVLMTNRESKNLIRQVKENEPDLLILLEPDEWWTEQFSEFEKELYPHTVKIPLDNTYGMALFSKLELINPEVRYVKMDTIPSITTGVKLHNGRVVQVFSLHPIPPAPNQNTDERDSELLLYAEEVRESDEPVIVAGDLNDVAWSRTTELFLKESQMLDPRLGRGYYNTFNAKIPFLRYPLDHVFFTKDFRLIEMKRGEKFGSDHFPIYISLSFEPGNEEGNDLPPAPDAEEKEEIEEIQREERGIDKDN